MSSTSIWHRIAPASWHALAFGLACGVLLALVGVYLWLSQPSHVTITGAAPAQLTVTFDGSVQVTTIEPYASPRLGLDA